MLLYQVGVLRAVPPHFDERSGYGGRIGKDSNLPARAYQHHSRESVKDGTLAVPADALASLVNQPRFVMLQMNNQVC